MKLSYAQIVKILGYVVAILATLWGVGATMKRTTPQPIQINVPPVQTQDTGIRKEVSDLREAFSKFSDTVHTLQAPKPDGNAAKLEEIEATLNSISEKLGELGPLEKDATQIKADLAFLVQKAKEPPKAEPAKDPGIVCEYCLGTGKTSDGKACGPCGGDGVMSPSEKAYDERVKADKAKEPKGDISTSIPWMYDYGEAIKLAKKFRRPLFLAFATEGCGPCEVRKQQTYPNSTTWNVITKEYIPVYVFTDGTSKTESEKQLALKYGVTRYPNAVVDRLDGSPFKEFIPPVDPNDFVTVLRAQ